MAVRTQSITLLQQICSRATVTTRHTSLYTAPRHSTLHCPLRKTFEAAACESFVHAPWWRSVGSQESVLGRPISKMSRSSSSRKAKLDVAKLFFPNIHREFLTDLLKKDGDFLLRRGTEGGRVLSVNRGGHVRHIKVGEHQKAISMNGQTFLTIEDMMRHFYEKGEPMGDSGAVLRNPIYNTCDMIDSRRVLFREQLGRGNFGEVWKAQLAPGNEMVAVKIVAGSASEKEQQDCIAEARLMSIMDNENVVKLKGISFWEQMSGPPRLLIILELCNRGSLDKLLEKDMVSEHGKVKAMLDAAKGLDYLHRREIIHRDIASRNCLVVERADGKEFIVKVADFGLSRLAPEQYQLATKRRLPVFSTPPDTLKERVWTTASDVWSFGIMMHETYCQGKNPYEQYFLKENMKLNRVIETLMRGFRLPCPNSMPKEMTQIATRCLLKAPERPSMAEVVVALKNFYANLVLP